MRNRAIATKIAIPGIVLLIDAAFFHSRVQHVEPLLALAAANNLADTRCENVHRCDRSAIVVYSRRIEKGLVAKLQNIVSWARDSAGFTVAEAAQKLGIDEKQLAAWEDPTAEDAPSIPQLRKVAALFKRPLAVFYLPEPPKGFMVMRDLRRLPASGIRRYSPALQMEIRAANERRELALELAADLEEQLPKFSLTAIENEDPEQVGERIRTAFDVTLQLQAQWRDNDGRTGFNAWRHRIESAGILVFQTTRFSSEDASGFAIAADTLPVIAVNRAD
jgi:transcriptional regulator with XRE-family HTH domain